MSLPIDILIAFPLAVFMLFIGIFVAWWWEDRFPAWRNAYPLGKFEIWYGREGTGRTKRRKRNIVDITEQVMTGKDGAKLILELNERSKRPDFFLPGQDKDTLLKILEQLKTFVKSDNKWSHGSPLLEYGDYRLYFLGIGSVWGRPEVGLTVVKKDKPFPDYFVQGQTGGLRNRKFLIVEQFTYPGKKKKFLGKKLVRFSSLHLVPKVWDIDNKEIQELTQALKGFVMSYAPISMWMSETQPLSKEVKVLERKNAELELLLDEVQRDSHSTAAQAESIRSAEEWRKKHYGFKDKPIRGAVSGGLLVVIPIVAAIVGEYGFTLHPSPIPVLFVFVAELVGMMLFASRRK